VYLKELIEIRPPFLDFLWAERAERLRWNGQTAVVLLLEMDAQLPEIVEPSSDRPFLLSDPDADAVKCHTFSDIFF
jgi:hypothetical protein